MASQTFQLNMRTGPNPGKIFGLTKSEMIVGRDSSNDIVINDAEVSRKHARIMLQAGGYVLEDLGSTNGTFVNGQRLLGPHVLRSGETIMFGENISLGFEPAYDENATLVSQATPAPAPAYNPPPPPAPQPRAARPAPAAPRPAPVGHVPPGMVEAYENEPLGPEKKKTSTLVFAGCGCLLIVLCVIVSLIAFDQLNLYCTGPFRALQPLYQMIGGGVCP